MNKKYKKCLEYIKKNQKELLCFIDRDNGCHLSLPHPFISPSAKRNHFGKDQFYWDSYFIILGLLEMGEIELARGIVDNFVYLYKKFGIIPARNRHYNLGMSQPPFLTSMALEIFEKTKNYEWLESVAQIAEKELKEYWMDPRKIHKAYKNLSRYCDHWHTHLTAEHESGWDMTSRFHERCMDYLPIDLNCLLYKYEIDLAHIFKLGKRKKKATKYLHNAKKRKELINKLMWNEEKGFYFDYDYRAKQQSSFFSIAGFYPLWAGIANKKQARKLKDNLKLFEYDGGVVNTQKEDLSPLFKQWDYPNGWPNQQWIVIKGLLNYGFRNDARRIAKKWLDMNAEVLEKTGVLWEKYNVVKVSKGKCGRYPTQKGFGWTNGVFIKLLKEFKF